jgi:hypothetical protein
MRKKGASNKQLAARDELLAEQEEASGRPPVWKEVYELLGCTGAHCNNNGFYCWRDPETQKHYKLETSVLGKLIDLAEEGLTLRTHNDVPVHIRQLLREQEELNLERKNRKRRAPDDLPAVNIRLCCRGHNPPGDCFGSEPEAQEAVSRRRPADIVIPRPRDKALMLYCEWHCNQVNSPTWKRGFVQAYQITKEACLDLKHIHEAQDVDFYIAKGIKLGIAKSFVGDVPLGKRDTDLESSWFHL